MKTYTKRRRNHTTLNLLYKIIKLVVIPVFTAKETLLSFVKGPYLNYVSRSWGEGGGHEMLTNADKGGEGGIEMLTSAKNAEYYPPRNT